MLFCLLKHYFLLSELIFVEFFSRLSNIFHLDLLRNHPPKHSPPAAFTSSGSAAFNQSEKKILTWGFSFFLGSDLAIVVSAASVDPDWAVGLLCRLRIRPRSPLEDVSAPNLTRRGREGSILDVFLCVNFKPGLGQVIKKGPTPYAAPDKQPTHNSSSKYKKFGNPSLF